MARSAKQQIVVAVGAVAGLVIGLIAGIPRIDNVAIKMLVGAGVFALLFASIWLLKRWRRRKKLG